MAETELKSSADDQQALALTVYNRELALVRDSRTLRLPKGVTWLAFSDVSAQIRPETARLYGELTVLEQNFDYDLLSPQKLLEKYVGREVGLVRRHPQTGEEQRATGTLLSVADGGVVFRIGDRIETGGTDSPWRFVFDEVPANLRERPTLTMLVDSPAAGEQKVELAYLSGGLSWKADYVATLDEETMDLTGWVTLTNTSGAGYRNARLQLLAGEVNQVREELQELAAPAMVREAPAAPVEREELFEYHLYTLPRPTTLANQQTKQVLLLQAARIPVQRDYRVEVGTGYGYGTYGADRQELPTQVVLRFKNERPALGEPLPAGILRFYQRDRAGASQFVGEQRIGHTPEGRELELAVGNAFDLTATRRQTGFRKGQGQERETSWEVTLFNAKTSAVKVQVEAGFPDEWKMLEESLPHTALSARTARWTVPVPAKGQTVLTYKIWLR
jgi:hypothetical protein